MKVKKMTLWGLTCLLNIMVLRAQSTDSVKEIHIGEVTVSTFRVRSALKNLPQEITVLTKKEIKEIPNASVDELLKKSANVDLIQYPGFSSNIGMRGFSPSAMGKSYVLLLVNGIPTGTQNPSTLDTQNADQVEIMRGPYSAFYGSGAMAGVVNIVTPLSKGKIKGSISGTAGNFGIWGMKMKAGGNVSDRIHFDLTAGVFDQTSDYKTGSKNIFGVSSYEKAVLDEKSYGEVFKNTRFNKYDATLRIGMDISKNWQVNLYQTVFLANHVYTNGNFWGTYGAQEKDLKRWAPNLSIDGQLGVHHLKFTPYFSNESVNYYNNISDTSYVNTNNRYQLYGFILQDQIAFGNHQLIYGIDQNNQKYINKRWNDRNTSAAPSQPDYSNGNQGVFLQSIFNFPKPKLQLAVGGRYDRITFNVIETALIKSKNSSETYQTINPNISLKLQVLPVLTVQASSGTAFLAPDAFKKTGNYISYGKVYRGNPDLNPEKSFSYDAGIHFANRHQTLEAGISYFDNHQKGLIVYDRSNKDTTTYKNADNSRMNGLELTGSLDVAAFFTGKFSLKIYGFYTHLFTSEMTLDGTKNAMKYVRKNMASMGIAFQDHQKWSMRLHARYSGNRFEDNWLYTYDKTLKTNVALKTADGREIRPSLVNETLLRYPVSMVVDFAASYTIAGKYSLGLSLQNIFDELYAEKDSYYMPGRSGSLSFTYTF